jgi:predicted metal-dependent hydrolase
MTAKVIVSGRPDWLDIAAAIASKHAFELVSYAPDALPDLVARLTDDSAAMLLVDAGLPDWVRWVTAARTSPATRRIPVIVVAGDPAVLPVVRDAGADETLTPGELEEMLPRLLAARARVYDADHMQALARQCDDPLPPEGHEAIRLFNSGEYYRQHDLFEALWMAESGPVRNLYRAILQIGVGYYHIEGGNYRGALKMLLRSVQWLTPLPDVCQGVDVAQLRRDSARVRLALEVYDPANGEPFDTSLFKPVRLVNAD